MSLIRFVRIFLFILIIVGLGLLTTERLWVPKIVNRILANENSVQVIKTTPVINKRTFGPDTIFLLTDHHLIAVNLFASTTRDLGLLPSPQNVTFAGLYKNKIYFYTNPAFDDPVDRTRNSTTTKTFDIDTGKVETLPIKNRVETLLINNNEALYLSGGCADDTPCSLHHLDLDTLEDKLVFADLNSAFTNEIGLRTYNLYAFSSKDHTFVLESSYGGVGVFIGRLYKVNLNTLAYTKVGSMDNDDTGCMGEKSNCPPVDAKQVEANQNQYYSAIGYSRTRTCEKYKFETIPIPDTGNLSRAVLSLTSQPTREINFAIAPRFLGCGSDEVH